MLPNEFTSYITTIHVNIVYPVSVQLVCIDRTRSSLARVEGYSVAPKAQELMGPAQDVSMDPKMAQYIKHSSHVIQSSAP